MTKRDFFTLIGFIFFLTGFTAITLSVVGLRWSWLSWLDEFGALIGFMTKIFLAIFGIALVAYFRTDYSDIKRKIADQSET